MIYDFASAKLLLFFEICKKREKIVYGFLHNPYTNAVRCTTLEKNSASTLLFYSDISPNKFVRCPYTTKRTSCDVLFSNVVGVYGFEPQTLCL